MRHAVAIALLALTGCASWFEPSDEEVVTQAPVTYAPAATPADFGWPAIPSLAEVSRQIATSPLPNAVKDAAKIVEGSADAAVDRSVKHGALVDVVRVSAWAMGLGFLVFLFGGFIPLPGMRAAGGWTVALGAAIATLAPWLNDFLGDSEVRWAGYAAFGILAVALSIGGSWWFLDKVRDLTRKRG